VAEGGLESLPDLIQHHCGEQDKRQRKRQPLQSHCKVVPAWYTRRAYVEGLKQGPCRLERGQAEENEESHKRQSLEHKLDDWTFIEGYQAPPGFLRSQDC